MLPPPSAVEFELDVCVTRDRACDPWSNPATDTNRVGLMLEDGDDVSLPAPDDGSKLEEIFWKPLPSTKTDSAEWNAIPNISIPVPVMQIKNVRTDQTMRFHREEKAS